MVDRPVAFVADRRIYAVAAAIVGSGIFQLVAPLRTMRRLGFHYAADWRRAHERLWEIGRAVFAVTMDSP